MTDTTPAYVDRTVGMTPLQIQEPLRVTVERVCLKQATIEDLIAHLAKGIHVDDDSSGGTPLLIAASHGRVDCLEMLLTAGASPNFVGRTEVNNTNRGAAAALDRWMNGAVSPLYVSAQEGHAECVSMLILAGAEVNLAHTKDGSTPLYVACAKGHSDCAARLLSAGAEIEKARTDDGTTPLATCCQNGSYDCAQLLLSYGASVDAQNADGHTPLSLAFRHVKMSRADAPRREAIAQACLALLDPTRSVVAQSRVAMLEAHVKNLQEQLYDGAWTRRAAPDEEGSLTPRSRAQRDSDRRLARSRPPLGADGAAASSVTSATTSTAASGETPLVVPPLAGITPRGVLGDGGGAPVTWDSWVDSARGQSSSRVGEASSARGDFSHRALPPPMTTLPPPRLQISSESHFTDAANSHRIVGDYSQRGDFSYRSLPPPLATPPPAATAETMKAEAAALPDTVEAVKPGAELPEPVAFTIAMPTAGGGDGSGDGTSRAVKASRAAAAQKGDVHALKAQALRELKTLKPADKKAADAKADAKADVKAAKAKASKGVKPLKVGAAKAAASEGGALDGPSDSTRVRVKTTAAAAAALAREFQACKEARVEGEEEEAAAQTPSPPPKLGGGGASSAGGSGSGSQRGAKPKRTAASKGVKPLKLVENGLVEPTASGEESSPEKESAAAAVSLPGGWSRRAHKGTAVPAAADGERADCTKKGGPAAKKGKESKAKEAAASSSSPVELSLDSTRFRSALATAESAGADVGSMGVPVPPADFGGLSLVSLRGEASPAATGMPPTTPAPATSAAASAATPTQLELKDGLARLGLSSSLGWHSERTTHGDATDRELQSSRLVLELNQSAPRERAPPAAVTTAASPLSLGMPLASAGAAPLGGAAPAGPDDDDPFTARNVDMWAEPSHRAGAGGPASGAAPASQADDDNPFTERNVHLWAESHPSAPA